MSGDPLEESGQQARQGIVQALQTAHTTAALMRGRGGDSRSRSEHDQRVAHAENREVRSQREHFVRVDTTISEAESKAAVNEARVEEIRGRITINEEAQQLSRRETDARMGRSEREHSVRVDTTIAEAESKVAVNEARIEEIRERITINDEAQQLSQRETEARMGRSDQDLARRDRLGEQQYQHNQQVHDAKIGGYEGRETRASELHELDVEYKELLIDVRRRAAGFTETLSADGDVGQTAASSAAFAAADAARDLSEDHGLDADAFEARFAEDAGLDVTNVIDVEPVDIDFDGDLDAPSDNSLDGESGKVTEPEYPQHVSLDAVRGLAQELTAEIHFAHAAARLLEPKPAPDPADSITESMDAALDGGSGESPVSVDVIDLDPGGLDVSSVMVSEPDL